MKLKTLKPRLLYLLTLGAGLFAFFFIVAASWIGHDVGVQCDQAQLRYSGDCVTALVTLLKDDTQPFKSRNAAIWALGQLGDRRALPVLDSFFTGQITPRESLTAGLSQYELKKAVNLAGGGFNLPALIWRWSRPDH